MGFATDAIHVGQEPDPTTGSIIPPIHQTSTYVQESFGKNKGYDYARTSHPNRKALERCLTKLEGGLISYVFSSGMAGIDSVFRLLRPGDHCIISEAVYGGVIRLTTQFLMQFGMEFSFVNTSCLDNLSAAIKPNTKMFYVETPTNPTMIISDLAAVAQIARQRNITMVVDNTFMSPYLQKPIELGAHIVVHSMTKYLNGHSDCTGGAVILTRQEDADKIHFLQRSTGAGLSPMDCWLTARGIKTLAVRMEQHNKNGMTIAKFLESHSKVKRVFYPGLESHPQHAIAKKQQRGFGAMISFDLGSIDGVRKLLDNVHLCSLAESLGGVETLISHPASMTHASVPAATRANIGITDGLVRISVGIEDVEDLVQDLEKALACV
ncbi:MAG: PLP-dependent transferase [Acidobacteria bacterium]|nr:PLP-dependent transferase [Acidobacteriota bacterium]